MKFFLTRTLLLAAAAALPALPAMAQSRDLPISSQLAKSQIGSQAAGTGGQVIDARSTGGNGGGNGAGNGNGSGQAAHKSAGATGLGGEIVSAPVATDAERQAATFTSFDMDVHLRTAEQYIAVRALMTVRNDGQTPLAHVPLQISSALNWERIRIEGRDVAFTVATLNSDADHTGQLHEAAVPLVAPLAPGASVRLDVTYSGKIATSAQRLLAIGAPADVALHSDWDGIGVDFTGLRGFGNVVWYPAASVPVILGDGARLFDEMGEHKLRMEGAHFGLRLTAEFPNGHAPTVALIDGRPAALTITPGSPDIPGVATASLDGATLGDGSTLGFEAPSLFLAVRRPEKAENATLWTLPGDEAAVPAWAAAAAAVTPFLQGWLGERPRSQLTLLDLPDPEDAPFETGALLATTIRQAPTDELDAKMANALAHAWMESPRAWLGEGVAQFMSSLWLEKESGRTKALESLEASRPALALAEPSSPGEGAGQPLAQAFAPIYYRTKAAYAFWMLRNIVGDAALSAALRAYNPAEDASKGYGRGTGSGEFERLLERSSPGKDLSWFFADWVDADHGLPDLTIQKVFPEAAEAGNTLVAVTIANAGYAAAEIPVTVETANTAVTQRVLVPARGTITRRILILGKPTAVRANDGTVPETEASVHVMQLGAGGGSSSSAAQVGAVRY